MTERRSYHHGDLRRVLLERAVQLIDQEPGADLSIRRLAADVGVSATAPKAHFQTKSDLMNALAARGFDDLCDRTSQVVGKKWDDPLEHTRQLALSYLLFSQEHPGLYRIMFSMGLDHDGDPELQRASSEAYSVLGAAVDSVFPNAAVGETEKRILAAWALVHGFATLLNNGPFADAVGTATDIDSLASITASSVVGWATAKGS